MNLTDFKLLMRLLYIINIFQPVSKKDLEAKFENDKSVDNKLRSNLPRYLKFLADEKKIQKGNDRRFSVTQNGLWTLEAARLRGRRDVNRLIELHGRQKLQRRGGSAKHYEIIPLTKAKCHRIVDL